MWSLRSWPIKIKTTEATERDVRRLHRCHGLGPMTTNVTGSEMCPCGKVRFASEAEALKIMTEKGWEDLHVYSCLGYWHLGHRHPAWNTRRGRTRRGR